jgi:DNA sulfur modification protein DndD
MKLVQARFTNFRLLKDISIDFSTDENKKLTIIRAENGTGKTTLMSGLIWGLYGSKVVKEKLYPMSLVDTDKTSSRIKTEVQIDFEIEEAISRDSRTVIQVKNYRLTRSVLSKVTSSGQEYSQEQDITNLLEKVENGYEPVMQSRIQTLIERSLPSHLKDIYFTDGDAALTFIESTATATEKRHRVKKAIESLLSMKDLEALIKTVKEVRRTFAKQVDNTDYGKKLNEAETSLNENEEWLEGIEEELSDLTTKCKDAEADFRKNRERIEEQLKLGDKEVLASEVRRYEGLVSKSRESIKAAVKRQCDLLNSAAVAKSLVSSKLGKARELLEEMNDKDKFPMQFIPVLKHALQKEECLCGAKLTESTEDGKIKINYMTHIIEDCKQIDLLNKRASDLFFGSNHYMQSGDDGSWLKDYEEELNTFFRLNSTRDEQVALLAEKEKQIDGLDDNLLQVYRQKEKTINRSLSELKQEIIINNEDKRRAKEKIALAKKDVDASSKRVGKNNKAGGKYALSDVLLKIYEETYNKIKTTELEKVSVEMNRIFLSMIGAESGIDSNGMIRGCKLTSEFDIQVFGPNNQPLNPDTELNGASRRAITLAFVLALTKVSNVTAANIIDTPLGMTSGLVKKSILENLVKQGTQIIMFLTYDEIKGVEDVLDKFSGKSVTLSFSGHYPKMLKNKPVRQGESFLCQCSHRECCQICERTDQSNMTMRA